MTKVKERMYNMDLCRVIAMMGILLLHFNRYGGIYDSVEKGSALFWCAWILRIIASTSVNVFAMLSGYLGYKKVQQKSLRLFELIFSVFFYCLIITVIFYFSYPSVFSGVKDVIVSFFPPLQGRFWYITSYIPLFLLQPFLNRMLLQMSEKQEKNACLIFAFLLGIIPAIIKTDLFHVNSGKSFLWLAVCYCIGHYIRRSDLHLKTKKSTLLILFGGILQLLTKIILFYLFHKKDSMYLLMNIGPFIIIESIGFFLLFIGIKIKESKIARAISFLSIYSFDVYILHCHPLILEHFIGGAFSYINTIPVYLLSLAVFIIAVYILCTITGFIKSQLIKFMQIDKILSRISGIFDNFMNVEV